jgi:hypothetical protein
MHVTTMVHPCVVLLAAGVPKALLGHQVTVLGVRPVFPPFTPKEYVALAQQCWAPRPEDRWVFLPGRCFLHCCRLGLEPLQLGGLIMPGDKSHMLAAATCAAWRLHNPWHRLCKRWTACGSFPLLHEAHCLRNPPSTCRPCFEVILQLLQQMRAALCQHRTPPLNPYEIKVQVMPERVVQRPPQPKGQHGMPPLHSNGINRPGPGGGQPGAQVRGSQQGYGHVMTWVAAVACVNLAGARVKRQRQRSHALCIGNVGLQSVGLSCSATCPG